MVHLTKYLISPVTTWLEAQLLDDSNLDSPKRTFAAKVSNFWSQVCASFRWGRRRLIQVPSRPSNLPTQVQEGVLHWSRLIGDTSTRKALWITADLSQNDDITYGLGAFQAPPAAEPTLAISVDVSTSLSVFWPLLHGLGTKWPEFNQQITAKVDEMRLIWIYSLANDYYWTMFEGGDWSTVRLLLSMTHKHSPHVVG
jgi:hypothetical protein